MGTVAERSSDGSFWRLNGAKMWITNGTLNGRSTGDVYLVYARTGEQTRGGDGGGVEEEEGRGKGGDCSRVLAVVGAGGCGGALWELLGIHVFHLDVAPQLPMEDETPADPLLEARRSHSGAVRG
jgi:hypothetical protein